MTPPNINPSPKAKFLAIKQCVDRHAELVQRPDLQTGLEQAFLQFQWELCGGNLHLGTNATGNEAAASYYKLLGVHEFIRTFKLLAQAPMPAKPETSGDISHTFK